MKLLSFICLAILLSRVASAADISHKRGADTGLELPTPINNAWENAEWPAVVSEETKVRALQEGQKYEYGDNVPQDFAEAMKWYRRAADHGNAIAQAKVAMMYKYGEGVPQSDTKAAEWIEKSKNTRKVSEMLPRQGHSLYFNNEGISYKPAVLPVPADTSSPKGCGKWANRRKVVCLPNYEAFPTVLDIPRISLQYGPLLDGVKKIILIVDVPERYETFEHHHSELLPDNLIQIVSRPIYESEAMHDYALDNGGLLPLLAIKDKPEPAEIAPGALFVNIKVDAPEPRGPDPLFHLDRGDTATIKIYRADRPGQQGLEAAETFDTADDSATTKKRQEVLSGFVKRTFGEIIRGTP